MQYLSALPESAVAAARDRLASAATASASTQLLRRLTHSQYNNTVRDLLGDYSRPADRFPPEDFVNGFKNQLRTQGMPPLLAEAYSAAAEKLALNAFRAGDVNGLVPCKPASARDAKCRDQFVQDIRPPRVPPAADRRGVPAVRGALQRAGRQDRPVPRRRARRRRGDAAVAEIPVSCRERGPAGTRPATTRSPAGLSYFLWDTMPDQRAVRGGGQRRTAEPGRHRARRARACSTQPPARQAVDEFFAQWLRFDRVLGSVKDRRRYPEFTPELAAMMVQETRMLLDNLVWNDGNFMEAFTADYSFLNSDLASLYGVPAPAGEFELVRFPAAAHRAGLLGQAIVPGVERRTGRNVADRARHLHPRQLLCQHVPNPPPGVNTQVPEPTAERPLARRQRMQAHVENPTCASCHRLMDPIGFGLENYDAVGRWREQEAIEFEVPGPRGQPATKTVSLPIDGKGEIAGLTNSAFSEPRSIGRLLADSRACQECVVKQVFRYRVWPRGDPRRSRGHRRACRGVPRIGISSSRNC